MSKQKAIAPLIIILIVAGGLLAGTAAGYSFREPLKKMIQGKNTVQEIDEAVQNELNQLQLGKNKFELEGTTISVGVSSKTITVKIKSSTNSIKELRLSEAPIKIADDTRITMADPSTSLGASKKDLTIADIPINSQVHVGGTISEGVLTATKVVVQKEEVAETAEEEEKQAKDFGVEGSVKAIGSSSITVNVTSADKSANSQKGKDLEIKVTSSTIIEKNETAIALSDIQVNDEVEIEGTIEGDVYTASKIEVKAEEEGEELEESDDSESPGNSQNRDKEIEKDKERDNQGGSPSPESGDEEENED